VRERERKRERVKYRVHKQFWDAKTRRGAFLGAKKRAAWRKFGIENFLIFAAPLSKNVKLNLKLEQFKRFKWKFLLDQLEIPVINLL
jgi:hypothetical protein